MATNVSYASSDTILETLVLHTLPDFGPHGDGIINTNFLFSALKDIDGRRGQQGKRYRVVDGGLEFWKGVMKTENTNFKWQDHTADMTADLQDPTARLRWDIMTFTGSIVINKKHEAMVKGRAMMKNFARTLRDQAESTIPNLFNSAFWNSSPGTNEPDSIPNIINTINTSGTVGGLSRSGNTYLQNESYSTAVSDIGSEAGIAVLDRRIRRNAIGSGGRDAVDLIIMTDELYSGLVGYLSTLQRYRPDDRLAKLGFDTIALGKAIISYENTNVKGGANTITDDYVYGINSNHFSFDVLRDGNFVWNPDGFERVGTKLSRALYFWVFCNIGTDLPCAHFVMSNVSTT